MIPPDLDPATKARIEAEEAYRAQIREKIATPQPTPPPVQPNYWTGIFLNLFLPGAGLLLVRQNGEGIAWLLAAIFAVFSLGNWLIWPAAIIGSFFHYNAVYDRLYPSPGQIEEEARLHQSNMTLLAIIVLILLIVGCLIVFS